MCNAGETLHPTCALPPSLVPHFQSKGNSQQEDVASEILGNTVSYNTPSAKAGTQMQKEQSVWRVNRTSSLQMLWPTSQNRSFLKQNA